MSKARKTCPIETVGQRKESARVDPFSSQTYNFWMFLPINATRSKTVATWACSSGFCASLCRKSSHGTNSLRRYSNERLPRVQQKAIKEIESIQRQASIWDISKPLAIPTYEQHVMSKEGGYNDRGLFLHVGAGAKILKVQYGWSRKITKMTETGRHRIQTRTTFVEKILKRQNVQSLHSSSSSSSMVEAVASAIDTVQDEQMGRVAAT